jgi:hypothetical protein
MSSNEKQQEEKDLTPDERLQWLKDRGVLIETPEDRKAAATTTTSAASTSNTTGEAITYVYIPADKAKPLQDCTFVPPATSSRFGPDALGEYLKPAFATDADKIDLGLFHQSQKDNPLHQLGSSGSATPKVSEETLQKVAQQGHVETFRLVHPTPGNKFTVVTLYLDEVGQMKRLPLNTRASDLAKVAGYDPPPIFHGDVFVGRTVVVQQQQQQQQHQNTITWTDLTAHECTVQAPWLRRAASDNLEHQLQFNSLTGKRGETQPAVAGSDGVAKTEEGYVWTQSEEDVEVTVLLPASAAITSKDVSVVFKTRQLTVSLKNGSEDVLVSIDLFERVDVDGCTWTIDKAKEASSVVVTLEKADEALWPRLEN